MFKKIAAFCGVIGLYFATSLNPAWAGGVDIGAIIRGVIGGVVSWLASFFIGVLIPFLQALVGQATSIIATEVNRNTVANVQTQTNLENYRQGVQFQRDAADLAARAELPATTCTDMAAQDSLGKADFTVKSNVFTGQRAVRDSLGANTNTTYTVDASWERTKQLYCTEAESKRGICDYSKIPDKDLAGADQDAAFLFNTKTGSSTYTGAKGSNGKVAQEVAAEDYIRRVTVGIPVEQLRQPNLDKTPQGRAYTELQRRYQAMISMSANSLNQIKESRTPQKDLGKKTQMDKVSGFTPENDMSMSEATRRFVATQFNPEKIQDLSTAVRPEKILRSMATQGAFALWIDYQNLEQNSRIEGLLANQLVLAAEQTLRPQLVSQRSAAANSIR